ncbi:protein takeout-like [Phlebotomus argentipes]|uniref:protein takeout-like n=1 Tax=Phlebotomus argentipes TaxID=94469 RepID=UPI0028936476|nr:protein takeout-like [Phlebotomus argentipes]
MERFVIVLSALIVLFHKAYAEFPPGIQKCRYGDSKCLRETASHIIKNFPGGIKEMNIQSIDPLFYDKIDVKKTTKGVLNIQLNLIDIDVYGFSNANILEIEGFTENPTNLYIHYTLDKVKVIGDYKMRAQILLFPMEGEGKCNYTMLDWDFKWNATVKLIEKDNQKYMKLLNHKTQFTTSRMYFHFDNLFNGDQALGQSANDFFNQNWQLFYDEMKPIMFKLSGKFFSSLVIEPFSKTPYKDFFLEN